MADPQESSNELAGGNDEDDLRLQREDMESDSVVCGCNLNTRKFASLGCMALCLLLGVVFLVAGKVKTDPQALSIGRMSVYRYITAMLLIAIIWMAVSILSKYIPARFYERWLTNHEEPAKQLIPTRLLVGVMFFGLGSSFMTMVELLEYCIGYACNEQDEDLTMPFYYAVRTIFIYTQLYFFYKLSSPAKKKLLICSHFLIMHLIAVNLGTWIVSFVHDSQDEMEHSDSVDDRNINETEKAYLFMVRHWGVNLVKNASNLTPECQKRDETLRSTAKNMEPYFYTFTMEYCLISAGLLLNVWLSLGGGADQGPRDGRERERAIETDSGSTMAGVISESHDWEVVKIDEGILEVGTLWRFGFILGLVYVPVFAAMIVNIMFTDTENEDKLIYVSFQFFFFASILIACIFGSWQLEKQDKGEIHSKVDFYLLGGAMVGVFFLDMFIIIASICEASRSPDITSVLIVTNVCELACSVAFTHFVYKAMERKLPSNLTENALVSASRVREVVSFLFMLNLCFWAMYTFEVKKSNKVLELVEVFYTKHVWFYISHIVYPLAVFFHFHGAVCMVEILNLYSKVPQKSSSSSAGSSSGPSASSHAVQA